VKRPVFLVLGGIILFACLGCVGILALTGAIGGVLTTAIGPSNQVAEQFMTALRDGDWTKANALCDPALQQQVGGASGLQRLVSAGQARPTAWSFSHRNVTGDRAAFSGTGKVASGKNASVDLGLVKTGGDWKINSFNITPVGG
jgi:hypothetical protein